MIETASWAEAKTHRINAEKHAAADLDHINPDDLLGLYLAETSCETLLTADEEVALARQIQTGHKARHAIHEVDCSTKVHQRLQAQIDAGQAARERLGRANTRLVVSIAKRYRGYGTPFVDLIQEGNEGLMRAVDRYNPQKGYRFSTYATWWIRQAVTRSLSNHGRVIRIPVHLGDRIRRVVKETHRLESDWGRKPNSDEIAVATGESTDSVLQMMRWANEPMSLELPIGLEGDRELGEMIEDKDAPDLGELSDRQLLKEMLEDLIGTLDPREARILRLRYGFEDGQMLTLQEVASRYGLSRERIRQVEREALVKLRILGARRKLEHFLLLA